MSRRRGRGPLFVLLLVLGLGSAANGLWMLVDPQRWFEDLPAGVPDFGAFNPHFVRDIGCAYLTAGAALVWAALSPRFRPALASVAALFFCVHALLHVFDTLRGAVEPRHWWLDLPGVYLPAILLVAASARLLLREGGSRAS